MRRVLLFIFVLGAAMLPAIKSQSSPDSPEDGIAVTAIMAFPAATATEICPGYGINVSIPYAAEHLNWASELGMDWIKVYEAAIDWPFKVLRRIPANWEDYDDLDAYCAKVRSYVSPYTAAYEIGNEPNLDWAWSEGARSIELPNPYRYTQVLKTAYTCIKALQPDAIVVSSGMATVGPYDKDTDPPAYPYAWNDLRFLQAMYDNGAKDYFDALGSHPHGFAYPPDQDPSTTNGLAFRRVEQHRAVMVANGDGDKQVWATEWGWLLRQEACQSEWETQGRWWQTVDETSQADYIRRAFEYAERHWPWMGPMFLFNLDFSMAGWYAPCDAMRYYAIRNTDGTPRQAYETLRDMPKWPYAVLTPKDIRMLLDYREMASAYTQTIHIELIGTEPLTYTVSTDASWLAVPSGVHAGSGVIPLTITTADFVTDTTYTASVTVTVATGTGYVHPHVTITIFVADEVFHVYLPVSLKSFQTSAPPTPTPTPDNPTPTSTATPASTPTPDTPTPTTTASATPASTPTPDTPTPTTTATATPAFTPPPEVCDERIVNGGFEFDGDWEIPSTGYPAAYTTEIAHSSNRSMRVGIVEPSDNRTSYSSARQLVTIPAEAISATLRFWLYPMSGEPATLGLPAPPLANTLQATALSGDAQYVLVLDEYGRRIDTLLWQRTNDRQWTLYQFDLMPCAGQTIKLHFGVYNDGWGGVTAIYLDDVSLEVCPAALPP